MLELAEIEPTPTAERDRRLHPRFEVGAVEGTLSYRAPIDIVNVGLGGVAVEAEVPLDLGRRYTLEVARSSGSIELEGTVVWCLHVGMERNARGDERQLFRAGLRFDEVFDEFMTEWSQELLDSIARDERRVFQRFSFATGSPIDLSCRERFEIRNVSLGGMLIETGFKPPRYSSIDMKLELAGTPLELCGRVVHRFDCLRDSLHTNDRRLTGRIGLSLETAPPAYAEVLSLLTA